MTDETVPSLLEKRLGRRHARQRLGIERDHEAQVFGQGINFFHIENAVFVPTVVRTVLKATGLYRRGLRNAAKVVVRRNVIHLRNLPRAFDGFIILQISDLHADMSVPAMARVVQLVRDLRYDLCLLTGDYRGDTWGPYEQALEETKKVCAELRGPVYGVLGNHDTIRMVPSLEAMGVTMLLNEAAVTERDGERIYLAGIDDAHFYRMDNIEKAAETIPDGAFSILVTHTPEIYRQAAHADFDLLLSGHTHGGQLCLPGGHPITLSAVLPRRFGAGPWRHHNMIGYTAVGAGSSVVPVRFNCPPEITLHELRRSHNDQ